MDFLPIGIGQSLQHGPQIVALGLGQVNPIAPGGNVEQEERDIVSTEKSDDAIFAALAFPTSGEADFPSTSRAGIAFLHPAANPISPRTSASSSNRSTSDTNADDRFDPSTGSTSEWNFSSSRLP